MDPSQSPRVSRRPSTRTPNSGGGPGGSANGGGGPGPSSRQRGQSTAGQLVEAHDRALRSVRAFLRGRTSYDVFPVSFRIIILDNKLEIKKALHVLLANCKWKSKSVDSHVAAERLMSPRTLKPSFRLLCGIATLRGSPGCSPSKILSTSSNITTSIPPTMLRAKTWNSSD